MIFRLSIAQMLFIAVFQFSNFFTNTYLFKENQSVQTVALYNFFMFLFWGICFYLGFKCCEKNTRIGQVLSGIFCLIGTSLLIFGINDVFWLGFFMGATGGFFWTSYLSIYRSLGKNSENGGTFAKVSLLSNLVTVFIPIFFGHLVEGASYFIGFIVLMILSLLMIGMGFFIPSLSTTKIKFKKKSFEHPSFITVSALQGFYFSFVNIAAGLLVFMSGKGEASVGSFATYYGLVTLLVTFLMAYIIPSRFQPKALLISSFFYLISASLFLTERDSSIIIFNFILAFSGPLFLNTIVGFNFAYINNHYENGEEGLLVREIGLTIGKLLFFGYMAIFGLDIQSTSFYIFLFISSCFPILTYLLVKKWKIQS